MRHHARKGCGHTCCRDDYFDAAAFGFVGKAFYCVGGAVCAEGTELEGYFHLFKEIGGFTKYGQVGCAAHYNAYSAIHD